MRQKLEAGIFSDQHLGYKQYSLAKRETDFEQAVMDAVFQMYQKGLKLILSGGDFLNGKNPNSRTIKFLKELNKFLIDKEMTLFDVEGNHNHSKPSWIDMARDTMSTSEYGLVSLDNKRISRHGWTFTGVPLYHEFPEEFMTDGDVLLLHTPVLEFVKYPSDGVPSAEELPHKHYPLIIVGDTHVTDCITVHDKTLVLSPGSTELTNAAHQDDKYWHHLRWEDGRNPTLQQHPLKTRLVIRLDITSEEDLDKAVEILKDSESDEPLVLGSYLKTIPNAIERLKAAVDLDKVILRPKPIGVTRVEAEFDEESDKMLPLSAYVEDYLDKTDPLYSLAVALCDETENGNELITTFIEERELELKNA